LTKDEGYRYQYQVLLNTNSFWNINQSFEFSR